MPDRTDIERERDIVASYLFAAYSDTDHAGRLSDCARTNWKSGSDDEALDDLRGALASCERGQARLRNAIERVEEFKRDHQEADRA